MDSTDIQKLSGLELRRAYWESQGWALRKLPNGYWCLYRGDGSTQANWQFFHDDSIDAWENAPNIDSDDGIALRELVKFCTAKGCNWSLTAGGLDEITCVIFVRHGRPSVGTGATPAEAICRALIGARHA